MYVRIKTRKNASGKQLKYAYLVKSKRRRKSKKHPKQKVMAYLGRVIELNNIQPTLKKAHKNHELAIISLLKEILVANDFKQRSQNHLVMEKGDIVVDFEKHKVLDQQTKKSVCLAVNEGFISSFNLKNTLNYFVPEKKEEEIGLDLAKKLISAGINPKKEDFVSICNIILHRK